MLYIQGIIRIPIDQVLANQRSFIGSVLTVLTEQVDEGPENNIRDINHRFKHHFKTSL